VSDAGRSDVASTSGDAAARVSIVVPAFNRERYVGATLDSVLGQSLAAWELVVFDDGSTDGTADVARQYADADPRIRLVQGLNGGVAAARNRGLAATDPRSEYVIFLDSDDLWEPDALATLVDVLDAHPEWSSCHALASSIDGDGHKLLGDDLAARLRKRNGFRGGRRVDVAPDEPTTFGDLTCDNWVHSPGAHLIRRDVVARIGGFDVETDPADDWDMAIRVSREGDIGFVDRPILRWRRHADTLTNTSPRWRRAYFRVRTKMLIDSSNTAEQAEAARLAFIDTCRSTWRTASRQARAGEYRDALEQSGRALYQSAAYLRARGCLYARRALRLLRR
jgi:glycosyltransferase involved in cell wall biosynthesis